MLRAASRMLRAAGENSSGNPLQAAALLGSHEASWPRRVVRGIEPYATMNCPSAASPTGLPTHTKVKRVIPVASFLRHQNTVGRIRCSTDRSGNAFTTGGVLQPT